MSEASQEHGHDSHAAPGSPGTPPAPAPLDASHLCPPHKAERSPTPSTDRSLTPFLHNGPADTASPGAETAGQYWGTMRHADHPEDTNCWLEADATKFRVRGAQYLVDKHKYPSLPSLCRLAAVDLFEFREQHGVLNIAAHPAVKPIRASKAEFLVVTFILPANSPPYQQCVLYFELPEEETPENALGLRLLKRFMSRSESDEFRNSRFKIIPSCVEGPWLVRKAVGNTPAILPRKLKTSYFWGERYFEIDTDVSSSHAANLLASLVMSSVKALVVECAFVIEGHEEGTELPEHILGTVRWPHTNMNEFSVPLEP
eukprot:m51a1_g8420 hypothetical protein (315) ;mRNA; r:315775-317486